MNSIIMMNYLNVLYAANIIPKKINQSQVNKFSFFKYI